MRFALLVGGILFLVCVFDARPITAEMQTSLAELELRRTDTQPRDRWPVRSGVPLAEGVVHDPADLLLHDASDELMPIQARALSRWADGSVKWVLIDSVADLEAGASDRLTLSVRDTAAEGGEQHLLAQDAGGQVVLDTGVLRVAFSPASDRETLARFALDADENGSYEDGEQLAGRVDATLRLQTEAPGPPQEENWLRDASDDPGILFRAVLDAERTVRIEENGPLHAIVRIDGLHVSEDGRRVFPYTLRFHAYRGSSRLQFQHTFVASEDVKQNFVRAMAVELPGVAGGKRVTVGAADGERELSMSGGARAASVWTIGTPRLYHLVSHQASNPVRGWAGVQSSDGSWREERIGEEPPGWLSMSGAHGVAAVGFRDFARMHPKELRASADGTIGVYLWPERGGKALDLRRRSEELRPEYVENGMDPHAGRGIALTHEWWMAYSPTDDEQQADARMQRGRELAAAASHPLRLVAPPSYVAETGAFGEFLPTCDANFPRLNAAADFGVRYLRRLRQAFELDGMIDWGDIPIAGVGAADHVGDSHTEGIPFRGYNGWANNDFGIAHGLFLHYLRTGDPHVLRDAEAMARHVMDVDTVHWYPEDPEQLGRGRRHDQQHWGNGTRGYCFAPYATIDLYLLTGDRRAYDVARLMADHPTTYGRYSTVRFWDISEEATYRETAERLLAADLDHAPDDWPFRYGQNFRSNSYDGIGYTFYDQILPDDALKDAAVRSLEIKARAWLTPWINPGHPTHLLAALGHKYSPTSEHTEMLKVMVWSVAADRVPEDPRVFALEENAPFGDWIKVNQQTLEIGRTDVFALYYLVGLPRVLARLDAMGVGEVACLDYEWEWVDRPSFREKLDPAAISFLGEGREGFDHEYNYYTEHQSPSYRPDTRMPEHVIKKWQAAIDRTKLYEDGRLIGPHPWPRSLMRRDGRIGWTRRLSGALVFTTPDNSDPRTNGRTYTLVYTSEVDEQWEDVASWEEVLDPARIIPFGKADNVWAYSTKQNSPSRVATHPARPEDVARYEASRQRHRFTIDGESQGPIHSDDGWGTFWNGEAEGWGRHQNLLMFTLPEGVDPREDGREYKLIYTSQSDVERSSDTESNMNE